jgi:hypothetical protein
MNPKIQRQREDSGFEVNEPAAPAGPKAQVRASHETR